VGGASEVFTFSVAKRGELNVKLTALTPPFANPLILLLGPQGTNGCAFGTQRAVLLGTDVAYGIVDVGTYCVSLADAGTMKEDESFTLEIRHS
jgi:hypothetical protein